jgi:sugar phosphate isomerase/epimerase
MWGVGRFDGIAPFASAAENLNFSHLELNYAPTPEMVDELFKIDHLPVSGVHIPCPWGTFKETPAYRLLLNSLDEDERKAALGFAYRTVDLAAQLGAGYVIVHSGAVAPAFDVETRLRDLYRNGQNDGEAFHKAREHLITLREDEKQPYLKKARESLTELAEHAKQKGIKLALENRYYYSEIPSLQEMEQFLDFLGPDVAGYWHDAGHAENQARLGFSPHEAWLNTLSPRMLGIHLHDIKALSDHHAPGMGTMDFAMLARHVPANAFRVLELNRANELNDVKAGLTLLREMGII